MKFSIVTAYVKQVELTKKFLHNLEGKIPVDTEVILVNAGNKIRIGFVTDKYIFKRIDLKENISFSHSMNTGIKKSSGDYVIVLGNDTFFNKESDIDNMLEVFKRFSDVYISTCNNTNPGRLYAKPYLIGRFGKYEEYDFVPAVCWMLSRECIDNVGLFDENFQTAQYEDNDYAIRVRKLNKRIIMDASVLVTHYCSAESSAFDLQKLNNINSKYLKEKHNLK